MTDIFEPLHDPAPVHARDGLLSDVKRQALSRRRRMAGTTAITAVLAAAVAFGATLRGSGDDQPASCANAVRLNDRSYQREDFNDNVLAPDELGDLIGTVTRTGVCPTEDGDASTLPAATELRVVRGVDPTVGVAAVTDSGVQFFRTNDPTDGTTPANILALDGVVEIGVNSDFDGATRWATVADPGVVAAIVEGITTAPPTAVRPPTNGMRAFLEFVRDDGLVTRTAYDVDAGVLTIGRDVIELPSATVDKIDVALNDAPPGAKVAGIELVGANATGGVHERSECRTDRPDLQAAPGEVLQVASNVPLSFAIISGPGVEVYSVEREELARGLRLPTVAGPVVVELVPADGRTSVCAIVSVTG